MKCLLCKYGCTIHESVEAYKASTCGSCRNFDKFEEAQAEDIVNEGITVYERKMSLPAYAEYKNNPRARDILLDDCVKEALFRHQVNGRYLCKS